MQYSVIKGENLLRRNFEAAELGANRINLETDGQNVAAYKRAEDSTVYLHKRMLAHMEDIWVMSST
jgi:hypothetical protein